jgi:hypothetical protein
MKISSSFHRRAARGMQQKEAARYLALSAALEFHLAALLAMRR